MAQIEFVGVMRAIFVSWRVKAMTGKGDGASEPLRRIVREGGGGCGDEVGGEMGNVKVRWVGR